MFPERRDSREKQLSMDFNTRQYMQSGDFELFYYNDTALKSVDAHEHDYYEFYFFLEGDVTYHIGDKSYQLEYGDCLLIPPDTPHYPQFHSYDKPYRRFVFWLNQDYHKKLRQTNEDLTYCFDYAQSHQAYRFHTDTITTQEIQGKLTDLMEELAGGRSFHRLVSELMAVSFLVYINRLLYDSLHQKSAVYENVLYLNICDYINRHLEEDLSLDSLSSFFYVSKYHISHIFKDNMGIPLHQYILKNGFTPARTPYCPTSPSAMFTSSTASRTTPAFSGHSKRVRCFPQGVPGAAPPA